MVRIKDIAKLANVSPSTVSNVIHKRKEKVSPEIYNRVEKILEEERYVTHMGARMLSAKGSRLVALNLAYSGRPVCVFRNRCCATCFTGKRVFPSTL